MPYCPICKGEFVEGITHCKNCDADLIAEKPQSDICSSPIEMNRYLMGKEVVVIHMGYIDTCREGQDLLAGYNIPTTIQAAEGGCNCHGQQPCVLACEPKELERVQKIFNDRFQKSVEKEGIACCCHSPSANEEIKLDGDAPITCPGCGTSFTPADARAECPECGLVLGV